jgi:DNA-binding MarR family transcriptional regulator
MDKDNTKVSRKSAKKKKADNSLAGERELIDHPGHLIRRLHQISVSIFLGKAKEYDLTQLQFASLVMIDAYPGIDQSSLGRACALDRQTISTVIRRLIEKNLVLREQKNQRTSALFLTGSGRALCHLMNDRLQDVDSILLAPLGKEEGKAFMKSLTKLVFALNEVSRAPQSGLKQLESTLGKGKEKASMVSTIKSA